MFPYSKSLLACLHPHISLLLLSSFVCDPTRTCHQLSCLSKTYCMYQKASSETWQPIGFLHAQDNLLGVPLNV